MQSTKLTSVEKLQLEETVSWSDIPLDDLAVAQTSPVKSMSTIENAEIVSVCVSFHPLWINSKCSKKVRICPGDSFVKCNAYDHKMLASQCSCGLICSLDYMHDEKQLCLTVFPEQLDKFLEGDTIEEYASQPKQLEEKILLLEKISLSDNKKNVVLNLNAWIWNAVNYLSCTYDQTLLFHRKFLKPFQKSNCRTSN